LASSHSSPASVWCCCQHVLLFSILTLFYTQRRIYKLKLIFNLDGEPPRTYGSLFPPQRVRSAAVRHRRTAQQGSCRCTIHPTSRRRMAGSRTRRGLPARGRAACPRTTRGPQRSTTSPGSGRRIAFPRPSQLLQQLKRLICDLCQLYNLPQHPDEEMLDKPLPAGPMCSRRKCPLYGASHKADEPCFK
ncbi:hypothetical protein GJAV_G00252510, partial [Gymnothorax javanicus]